MLWRLVFAGGFFAKDMAVFHKAAGVLLEPATRQATTFKRLLVAQDCFAIADADVRDALMQVRTKRLCQGICGHLKVSLETLLATVPK